MKAATGSKIKAMAKMPVARRNTVEIAEYITFISNNSDADLTAMIRLALSTVEVTTAFEVLADQSKQALSANVEIVTELAEANAKLAKIAKEKELQALVDECEGRLECISCKACCKLDALQRGLDDEEDEAVNSIVQFCRDNHV